MSTLRELSANLDRLEAFEERRRIAPLAASLAGGGLAGAAVGHKLGGSKGALIGALVGSSGLTLANEAVQPAIKKGSRQSANHARYLLPLTAAGVAALALRRKKPVTFSKPEKDKEPGAFKKAAIVGAPILIGQEVGDLAGSVIGNRHLAQTGAIKAISRRLPSKIRLSPGELGNFIGGHTGALAGLGAGYLASRALAKRYLPKKKGSAVGAMPSIPGQFSARLRRIAFDRGDDGKFAPSNAPSAIIRKAKGVSRSIRRAGEVAKDTVDSLKGNPREGNKKRFYEKSWFRNAALTGVTAAGIYGLRKSGVHVLHRKGRKIEFRADGESPWTRRLAIAAGVAGTGALAGLALRKGLRGKAPVKVAGEARKIIRGTPDRNFKAMQLREKRGYQHLPEAAPFKGGARDSVISRADALVDAAHHSGTPAARQAARNTLGKLRYQHGLSRRGRTVLFSLRPKGYNYPARTPAALPEGVGAAYAPPETVKAAESHFRQAGATEAEISKAKRGGILYSSISPQHPIDRKILRQHEIIHSLRMQKSGTPKRIRDLVREESAAYGGSLFGKRGARLAKAGVPLATRVTGAAKGIATSVKYGVKNNPILRARAVRYAKGAGVAGAVGGLAVAAALKHRHDKKKATEFAWDIRDPRGNSARVYHEGAQDKRERRGAYWYEKKSTHRRAAVASGLLAAAALAGGAGLAIRGDKALKAGKALSSKAESVLTRDAAKKVQRNAKAAALRAERKKYGLGPTPRGMGPDGQMLSGTRKKMGPSGPKGAMNQQQNG